jgi:orotidine-5'-phosphate decarboxylase
MKFFDLLESRQKRIDSLVCVGLDPEIDKIPKHLLSQKDPIYSFCKEIIDATKDYACAYKPNIAFFEAMGVDGLKSLKKVVDYAKPLNIPVIVDAKRNDIGNTAKAYAKAMFEYFGFDAMTVNAYMGAETVLPFSEYAQNGIFVLAKTSNPGSNDFQNLECNGSRLYKLVVQTILNVDTNKNIGFVVGATYPEELKEIRQIAPDATFLIPGLGAQGGDVEKTIRFGLRKDKLGAIINSSRGVIYASGGEDFAEAAGNEAKKLRDEINRYR